LKYCARLALAILFVFCAEVLAQQSSVPDGAAPSSSQSQSTTLPDAPSLNDYPTVPIITGAVAAVPTVDSGHFTLISVLAPVVLIPIGDHWLVESRLTFEGDFTHNQFDHFGGQVQQEVDYAQLDYIANPYLTITAGRFLTPFGIYNERIYPRWIRNLQTEPLILPLEEDSSNGVMARGGIKAGNDVDVLYAGSFSVASTIDHLESDRQVGGRFGFFFPKERVEVGFSARHFLQEDDSNIYGFHFEWQPRSQPFDLRQEYANGAAGHGYWIEPAYRLSQVPFWQPVLGNLQVVARMQQFFLKQGSDELPGADTQQIEGGVNYYFRDGLRATASFGRHFSSQGDGNVWTIGMTWRFAFPLGPAK
jgi:hypothetical protein